MADLCDANAEADDVGFQACICDITEKEVRTHLCDACLFSEV